MSNTPLVTVIVPVACVPGVGPSTAVNVPAMRVAVMLVMVTAPVLPVIAELQAETCDPFVMVTPMVLAGDVFASAYVPAPGTLPRVTEIERVLLFPTTARVVVVVE